MDQHFDHVDQYLPSVLNSWGREPVIIVELDAKDTAFDKVLSQAKRLASTGVHAISVGDNPTAQSRPCSLMLSHLIQQTARIRTICHLQCRDRNALDLQSRLFGAHAAGVTEILALTGDRLEMGTFAERIRSAGVVKKVAAFDMSSKDLIRMIGRLNSGLDFLGEPLRGGSTNFCVGASFDTANNRLEPELKELEKKLACGAQFAMSQFLFDPGKIRLTRQATADFNVPIFLGLVPFSSLNFAVRIHNLSPVPESTLKRLEAVDRAGGNVRAEGVELCKELVDIALAEGFDGIYLLPPGGNVDLVVDIAKHIQQRVRAGWWNWRWPLGFEPLEKSRRSLGPN